MKLNEIKSYLNQSCNPSNMLLTLLAAECQGRPLPISTADFWQPLRPLTHLDLSMKCMLWWQFCFCFLKFGYF